MQRVCVFCGAAPLYGPLCEGCGIAAWCALRCALGKSAEVSYSKYEGVHIGWDVVANFMRQVQANYMPTLAESRVVLVVRDEDYVALAHEGCVEA